MANVSAKDLDVVRIHLNEITKIPLLTNDDKNSRLRAELTLQFFHGNNAGQANQALKELAVIQPPGHLHGKDHTGIRFVLPLAAVDCHIGD